MTATTTGAAQRLPIIASVAKAYRNVIGRPAAFVLATALPGAVMAAVTYAIASSPLWGQAWVLLPLSSLIIPLVYVAQTWLRHRLLGESTLLRITGDKVRCYGRLLPLGIALSIWLLCVPFCVVVAGALLLMELVDEPWEYLSYRREGLIPALLWIGLIALFTLPAGRFFLFVPTVAIGRLPLLRTAWRSSRGHGLSISLALILLFLSFAIVELFLLLSFFLVAAALDDLFGSNRSYMDSDDLRNVFGSAALLTGTLLSTILSAELLAIAFRWLTGWTTPQVGVLERFD